MSGGLNNDTGPGRAGGLVGPTWLLMELQGAGTGRARITATFDDEGHVSGSAGCNRYRGAYQRSPVIDSIDAEGLDLGGPDARSGDCVSEGHDAGPLSFSHPAATMMMCVPEIMVQEDRFFKVLPAVAGFRCEGGLLELLDRTGGTLMLFKAEPGTTPEGRECG